MRKFACHLSLQAFLTRSLLWPLLWPSLLAMPSIWPSLLALVSSPPLAPALTWRSLEDGQVP